MQQGTRPALTGETPIAKHNLKPQGDFLPDLCSVQAVFHLVLVAELLAIALVVFDAGVLNFDWYQLGLMSILVQWVVLTSAACLCPLRPWFRRQSPVLAGSVSYGLVLAITLLYTYIGGMVQTGRATLNPELMLSNLLIAGVFAGVVLRYFYLQQQVRNQQQAELRARIQALQSRIRPHFLFNSMNSIVSLIDSDPQTAERLVLDLSVLFRATLSEATMVPLERELDLCKRFASIEQLRLGDRLQMEWRLPAIPSDAMIPGLLLQPLVENAIYHGIQPLTEGGVVVVSVVFEAEDCVIGITNPVGDQQQATNAGNGLALENIRNRLEAHYGNKGKLQVISSANRFDVWLRYPATQPEFH